MKVFTKEDFDAAIKLSYYCRVESFLVSPRQLEALRDEPEADTANVSNDSTLDDNMIRMVSSRGLFVDWTRDTESPEEEAPQVEAFTADDYEAAVVACGWVIGEIDCFHVADGRWSLGSCGYSGVWSFSGKPDYVTDVNVIQVVHKNGETFDWKRGEKPTAYFDKDIAYKTSVSMSGTTSGRTLDTARGLAGFTPVTQAQRSAMEANGWDVYRGAIHDEPPTAATKRQEAAMIEQIESAIAASPVVAHLCDLTTIPDEPAIETTHSATLQFKDGTVVEIPEPGEGWECVEHFVMDEFHPVSVSGLNDINHEPGTVIYAEYFERMKIDVPHLLEKKRWQRPVAIPYAVVEHYQGSEYRPPEPEYLYAAEFPKRHARKVIG